MTTRATVDRIHWDLMMPAVHMNGTSGTQLMGQLEEVERHLSAAFDALKRAAPNGRDYYVIPERDRRPALEVAEIVHTRRLDVVYALMSELSDEMAHIADQM